MTETPKFTPGPWRWWTSNSWRRLTAHNLPGGQYKQEGDVICPVVAKDGHPDLSVSQADARLIAAAPELYTALYELVAARREVSDTFLERDANDRAVNRLIDAEKAAADVLWKAIA